MFGDFLDTFAKVWTLLGKLGKFLETSGKVGEAFASFLEPVGKVGKMWQMASTKRHNAIFLPFLVKPRP